MRDDSGDLKKAIEGADGWLSLEKFMALALYDEDKGYYSARIRDVGSRGDFSTTATLSRVLAKALLARYKDTCKRVGKNIPLIEIGGGDGSLAAGIARELGFWGRLRTHYYLVETSLPLREIQRKKAGRFIRHCTHPREALEACGGAAFIFSNELVDAFPARIFQKTGAGWEELGLSIYGGRLREEGRAVDEIALPESSLFLQDYLEGQRIEVHQSFFRWCDSWAPVWRTGEMVTVDYGSLDEDLYYRRPKGSLRGYFAHNRIEGGGVYSALGKMDLTCDVNFTDLIRQGEKRAWQTTSLMYQKDFLMSFSTSSDADRFLNNPLGAGTAFRVLIQTPADASADEKA